MATHEEAHEPPGAGSLQVAMDDIMDVITVYKCKFCSFSCGEPGSIRQHVQDVHVIVQEDKKEEMKDIPDIEPGEIPLDVDEHHAMDHDIPHVPQVIEPTEIDHDPMQENHTYVTTDDTEGTPDQEEEHALQTTVVCDDYQGLVVDSGTQCVDITQTSSDPQVGFNKDLTEVYLCGQCNFGFDSIESCKSHIVKDHNVAFEEENEEYEEESQEMQIGEEEESGGEKNSPFPRKVSVGTQVMSRKKPGRKRKIRDETSEETLPIEEVYGEEEAAVIEEHRLHQQEEELENDVEDEGRTRRRRKLPSRLTQLYYVGKPVTARRAPPPLKRVLPMPFKISCCKRNCNARFRTQEALEVHLACHKVLVDQGQAIESFSCVKCNYTWPQWKVMRMHLWREHSVDTDLYSCETCDFKSDTMGRVERHAQIHG